MDYNKKNTIQNKFKQNELISLKEILPQDYIYIVNSHILLLPDLQYTSPNHCLVTNLAYERPLSSRPGRITITIKSIAWRT
uniref:MSP domain-containing protein n=1 Tax=Strongyloides papillosus TaxID=174720 RepID=A0A0N5BWB2_STREA